MAKNYQRHSKGGRFKRSDIGDAGIRSFSEQQQNIIDSIRLQQKQDKEISRDQISGFDRSTAKELENQRVLETLESNIFSNKVANIKTRAKNEIDAIEGEAKELQKKSDFWKDFSTTYSQQYGELATQALEFKDRLWADKMQTFFMDQYPNLIEFDADNFREGAYETLDQRLKEALDKTIKAPKHADPKEEAKLEAARQEAKTIRRLMTRTNRYLDSIKVKQITENIDSFEKNLKQTILNDIQNNPNSKLKWNAATIPGHYQQAAKNLIIELGIRQNSKEAKELIALFVRKGTASSNQQNLRDEAIQDKATLDNGIEALLAASDADKGARLYDVYADVKTSTRSDGKGGFTIGIVNPKEAYFVTGQLIAERYSDVDLFVEHMQNMPVTSHLDPTKQIPWVQRFSKDEVAEEYRLREIWFEANKDTLTKKDKIKKLEDAKGVEEIGKVLGNKDFDVTSKAGQKVLDDLEKGLAPDGTKFKPGPKSLQLIRTIAAFDFAGKNQIYLDQQIVKAWKDGRPDEFAELYALVNQDTKNKFDKLKLDMDDLSNAPGYKEGKGVYDHAKAKVSDIIKSESAFSRDIDLHERVIVAYEDAFYKKFRESEGTPSQRWNEALTYVDDLIDNGKGVFRRENEGADTIWQVFTPEDLSKDYDPIDLDEKLNTSESAVNQEIENLITNHQNVAKGKGGKELVSLDTVDEMLLSINRGETVEVPYSIQKLYHSQTGPKKKWKYQTPRHLAQEVLGIEIPEGTFELYEFIDQKSPLNIPDKESYSNYELSLLNAVRMEFDEWPIPTALGNIINSAGGLEFFDEDFIESWDTDPQRDPLLYFIGTP